MTAVFGVAQTTDGEIFVNNYVNNAGSAISYRVRCCCFREAVSSPKFVFLLRAADTLI